MYRHLLRSVLFALPAEKAHELTLRLLSMACAIPGVGWLLRKRFTLTDPALEREFFGLRFPNPVGLAAGLDKNGRYLDALACLGFGFLEVGTVTPRPQSGNPKPRLFRLPADRAIINRMGFNNEGVDTLVKRLRKSRPKGLIIGGNIGKNKDTPNERAIEDYEYCFTALHPYVDYFVVNVSSPNTPGLRALQERRPLTAILQRMVELNQQMQLKRPILLKISPDLNAQQLDEIAEIVRETGIDGIIATNTTIGRADLNTPEEEVVAMGPGGLSGAPLREDATRVLVHMRKALGPDFPLIGVGGIDSPEAALERLHAGANLLQVYTGLIYEGPALVRRINEAILRERGK
ncbi:MAG: dihydroorotate dehydrogenase (quinone) [Saprospiraceae bacterium]|nr:MAG: dihydroorotate dehydrogenase (quinone) [Saprospiraceae bacterium]